VTAGETLSKNLANMTDGKNPEAIIVMIKATLDDVINAYYNLSTNARQSLKTAYPELTKFFQSPFWELIMIVINSVGTNDSVFNLSISGMSTNIEQYLPPYVLNFSKSLTQTDIQVLMQAGMQYHASQADTLAYIKTQSPSLAAKIVALNNTIYANVSNPDGRQWIYTTMNAALSFSQSMISSMSASSTNHESPNITAIVLETMNFTMGVVNNFTKLSAEAKQSLAVAFPNVAKLVQSTIFKIAICVLKIFNEYPEAFDLVTPYFNMGSMSMGSGGGGLNSSFGSYMSIGNSRMTDLLPANKGEGSFLDTVISMVSKK